MYCSIRLKFCSTGQPKRWNDKTRFSVAMLLVLLLVVHTRADWVEITQLHKPTHLTDTLEFHEERRRPSFPKESNLDDDDILTKPLTSTEHINLYDDKRSKPEFSAIADPFDGRKFKPQFSPDIYNENKRFPIQFSTEPGFLAEYKRNRIYINHTIDHSSENHWTKGVVHRVPNPTTGSVKRIHFTTEEPAKVKYEETDLTHELIREYTMRNPFKKFEERKPEFVTKEETFQDDGEDDVHFVKQPPEDIWSKSNERPQMYPNKSPMRRVDIEAVPETIKAPSKIPKVEHKEPTRHLPESNLQDETKSNTMKNVVKFAKVVADTISRNTRRSVGSKLRYLEDLKDTIMVNIEDRIESLWPDDTGGGAARRRRWSRSAETRGHVEFPSSESALMTISFLTFAVYLIKLVLQVIQTYKNKTMMVTPAVFAAVGRAASGKQQLSHQ